ncbi:MAG: O-antigen ligase family protein [Solirubrobacteraceae bacterium]
MTTAAWYALMGLLCVAGAWLERRTLRERLASGAWPLRAFVVAGSVLALWFLLNVAFVSHGSLPHTFAGELVLWTLPSALLGLSLPAGAVRRFALALAALALAYVAIEIAVLAVTQATTHRFSPIAHLDPISAALYPGLGAIALLAVRGRTTRDETLRLLAFALLVAAAVLPGSRGPILALGFGVAAALPLLGRSRWLTTVPALAAGLAVGLLATAHVGTDAYLASSVQNEGFTAAIPQPRGHPPSLHPATQEPISTFRIRREWWAAAVHAIPSAPIIGHGVAMFVDETPEAHEMGVAGARTYPHNSPLESLYSLGILGAVPYAFYLDAALVALLLLARRRRRDPASTLAVGVWVFAFVETNLSGEIGTDAVLWCAAALAVGLQADIAASR